MSVVAKSKKFTLEIIISCVAIAFTLGISIFVGRDTIATFSMYRQAGEIGYTIEFVIFSGIILILVYGSLVYLLARLFYYVRLGEEAARPAVTRPMNPDATLTVLIPSYREEKTVIWRTLISASMVEHPNRRAVLLVDVRRSRVVATTSRRSPPRAPSPAKSKPCLRRSRRASPARRPGAYRRRRSRDRRRRAYEDAAAFLREIGDDVDAGVYGGTKDHMRDFFVRKILREPAADYRARAADLRAGAVAAADVEGDLDRLAYLFRTKLEFFERKLYFNTPKGADKATNLNAYLSMMGRRCRLREDGGRTYLDDVALDTPLGDDVRDFPDSDYVLVLDADSIVLPRYARTLLGLMEAPEGQKIGVAQTPYLTFPNATSMLERVAGATTDIQFIIHQGMGALGAGFWVGANALVRMPAFRQIAEPATEDGFQFHKFVQDRTVIEDTGSTIDLRAKGWSVHNHVEPLAWSATPSDFGTLTIQRRRWANGGLILLPDLMGYLRRARFTRQFVGEAFMRFHYLSSQAFASLGVLLLLLYLVRRSLRLEPAAADRRAVFLSVWPRPASPRLRLGRPAARLRAEPAAAAGHSRRRRQVGAADRVRHQDAVRAHTEDRGPHGGAGLLPRHRTAAVWLDADHVPARRRPQRPRARLLRALQRARLRLRLHRNDRRARHGGGHFRRHGRTGQGARRPRRDDTVRSHHHRAARATDARRRVRDRRDQRRVRLHRPVVIRCCVAPPPP